MDTSIIGKEDQASFKSLSKNFLQKKYRKGKNEQNDRQFKKKNMKYYFLFHQVFLLNSSKLENGGNKESMKIRNPFQNSPPLFVGDKKGLT